MARWRRLGRGLAGHARRPRDHPVHLFPAVRRPRSRPHLRRADLRSGAHRRSSFRTSTPSTTSSGPAIPKPARRSRTAMFASPRNCSSRSTTSNTPTCRGFGNTSTPTKPKRKSLLDAGRAVCWAMQTPAATEKKRFPLLATYELALKCSNLFNLLDARGAISVTERVGVIGRIRDSCRGCRQSVRPAASSIRKQLLAFSLELPHSN